MIQAYSVADVREVENAAMAVLPDGELMQRASRALAGVAGERLDEIGGSRVVALVGGGNNGGDALYAAAWLAGLGLDVGAVTTAMGTVHPGAAATAADLGVTIVPADEPGWRALLAQADVVIDGITGIGARAACVRRPDPGSRRFPRTPTSLPSTCPAAPTRPARSEPAMPSRLTRR